MEKFSFFISAMIAAEMLIISIIYLQNFFLEHMFFDIPAKLKHMPCKVKSAMAKSLMCNLFLLLLVTLLVKGIFMVIPWSI